MESTSGFCARRCRLGRRERGVSIIGFIFVVAVAVIFTIVGFRVLPAYMEYFSVKGALEQAVKQTQDLNNVQELRSTFQKRADSGYIETVKGSDITVQKVGNNVVASVAWTRKLHLVSNVYIVIEFETQANR